MAGSKTKQRALLDSDFANLSLIEEEIARLLKEKFDPPAGIIPGVIVAGPIRGPLHQDVEETRFSLVVGAAGPKKLHVLKVIRAARPDLGLKEVKSLVDNAPFVFFGGIGKNDAERWNRELVAAGATVAVYSVGTVRIGEALPLADVSWRDFCAADLSGHAKSSESTIVTRIPQSQPPNDDAPLRVSDGAFRRDLDSMLPNARGKWAAYLRETRVGVFDTKDAAVHAAMERGAPIDEVYVRCILPARELSIGF